jgi:DNA (cytosine-5)-methyltransferase 1
MHENIFDMRSRRLELGLPQREVALRACVRETQLRKWERGLELPDSESAKRLGKVLKVSPHKLLSAQEIHAEFATPGEGYTTAEAGKGEVTRRKSVPPSGIRRVLDIFCGAGGLSYGFERSEGFITTCGIDLLPDRIKTFMANHHYATGIAGDLRAYSLHEIHKLTGHVDVVVGGPPCQGFSSIRPFRNLTEGDPRNSLVEHYVLVINHLRPEWFVFENVVGILTHENGSRLRAVLEGFRSAGYSVEWRVVNAALYGVAQHRERVVIVGNRRGIPFLWPNPSHRAEHKSMAGSRPEVIRTEGPLFCSDLPPAVTLMEAIDDLPPIPAGGEASGYIGSTRTEYQRKLRAGSNLLTLHRATNHSAKMLEIIRHAGSNISALPQGMVKSGFSSCYSRLNPDKPSTTLTVNFVHPASNRCIHPYQDRALTPREGARIQSFPDSYQFHGTTAQVVKQIGNAVPPILGQRIAEAIISSEGKVKNGRPKKSRDAWQPQVESAF